jgi:hypothetical protein
MKSTLSFLEELGRNADLRFDRVDFEALMNNDDFSPEVKEAILNRDRNALEMLLNARSKIVCMLIPAEENEDEDEDEGDDSSEEISSSRKQMTA